MIRQDVTDALEVLEYIRAAVPALPATTDKLEYELLLLGRTAGMSLNDLAAVMGVSKQAVDFRIRRHRASAGGLVRSEHADRAARATQAQDERWRHRHSLAVRTTMAVFDKHRHEVAGDHDLVDHIDILCAPEDSTRPPAVTDLVYKTDLDLLDLVVRTLRKSHVLTTLDPSSRILAALEQGEELVRQYAKIAESTEKYRRSTR